MTIPPPEPVALRRGRHVHSAPARTLGITRITQTSELPPGINALASADGKTIIVRAGLDKATRRRAVRGSGGSTINSRPLPMAKASTRSVGFCPDLRIQP